MSEYSQAYQQRYDDWQRHLGAGGWDIRPWLEGCCVEFEQFVLNARGTETEHFTNFEQWTAVALFRDLAFYGMYGAIIGEPRAEVALKKIQHDLQLAGTVLSNARGDTEVPLAIVDLAQARHTLDTGSGTLSPYSLATLAKLSVGRVQNLMAGKDAVLTPINGRIRVDEAAAWLANRHAFWPSIWQAPRQLLEAADKVRVPVAADGSIFHPALRRRNGFMVGEKGAERIVATFDAALDALCSMPEPRWRRPNPQGNWGIVKGVGWTFKTLSELESIRLPP